MGRDPRRLAAAVATAAALACTRGTPAPPAPTTPPAAVPAPPGFRGFDQRLFTIALPAGWERVRVDDSGRRDVLGAENLVRFEDGRGRFFAVLFDHAGFGFSADAVWRCEATPSGDALRIVLEEPPCRVPTYGSSEAALAAESDECPAGDHRLHVAALAPALRGHAFTFFFGDEAREDGVDLAPFREILATFRAK